MGSSFRVRQELGFVFGSWFNFLLQSQARTEGVNLQKKMRSAKENNANFFFYALQLNNILIPWYVGYSHNSELQSDTHHGYKCDEKAQCCGDEDGDVFIRPTVLAVVSKVSELGGMSEKIAV